MQLRAKKPEQIQKRLKMFVYGPAGVGKTTCALNFPSSYIIDCEKGTENYDKLINSSGSAVFQTTNFDDLIQEAKSLLSEKHDYRTFVIDPITPIYEDLLAKAEQKVGTSNGRHYGEAGKQMKRLSNTIMALDMNVIVTAHAKTEYGQNLTKLGITFDAWRKLDYWFDLVVEIGKNGKKRFGKVVKSRLAAFPDEDSFEWSYETFRTRYGAEMLEKQASVLVLADADQIKTIEELLAAVRLPEGTVDKWFSKAGVDRWQDMPADTLAKCIEFVKSRLPGTAA